MANANLHMDFLGQFVTLTVEVKRPWTWDGLIMRDICYVPHVSYHAFAQLDMKP
jgi:hypothetical protein